VARGEADAWSDLDLIIVADTARPFFERFKDFSGLYDVWPRLDLLVYTADEFARMVADDNPLVRRALEEGVVLHEAGES
jgi:predicted nucleotidyltransferase